MVILKRAALAGACAPGLALFDQHAKAGEINYTAEVDLELRTAAPEYWSWVRNKQVVPLFSYGSGYGSGSGDGYGDGYGYGYGYGYGSGSGSGSGYG